jgi:hypothetical protein
MTHRLARLAGILIVLATAVHPAAAQSPDVKTDRPLVDGLEIVTGLMEFDLSGTGTAIPVSIRATMPVTRRLGLEVGATMAAPQQQSGSSTFVAPEAHLRYSWQLGAVEPFVVGGGGFSMTRVGLGNTRWEPTFSGGGGIKIHLDDRIYLIGEMRLRGIAENFSASTAEWLGGIGWKLW